MQAFILGITYVILFGAALAHVLWALGVWWPIWDEQRLARTVVGAPRDHKNATRLGVGTGGRCAGCLGGRIVWTHTGVWLSFPTVCWSGQAGPWSRCLVCAGLASYVLPLFSVKMEEPFARLNLMFYGPLCLILAAGVLVGALAQQAARDDLRLNFRGTFEDVQDTCIAQHAADLVFQSEAVAAVDL